MNFDCIVVGGGIIGMTTARELSSKGAKVALFERKELGREASLAAGGILSSMQPWSENIDSLALSAEGKASYEEFVNELKHETGIDTEYYRSGLLMINKSDVEQSRAWAKNNNITYSDTYNDFPNNVQFTNETIFFPDIAQIRVPYLLKALRDSLIRKNVAIHENEKVAAFEFNADKCVSIKVGTHHFYADKFIITAGAWTSQLLKNETDTVNVKPVLGQMLCVKFRKQELHTMILDGTSYLIPRLDGHILIGSTMENTGFNKLITSVAREKLMDWAISLWPDVENSDFIKHWSGLRPATKQSKPYLGKLADFDNVYINAGHFRKGILQAHVCAKKMVDMVYTD